MKINRVFFLKLNENKLQIKLEQQMMNYVIKTALKLLFKKSILPRNLLYNSIHVIYLTKKKITLK